MTSFARILLAFGVSTTTLNLVLYFAYQGALKHQGRVQLAMSAFGILCLLIAFFLRTWRRHCFFIFHRWEYSRLQTYRVCERCGDIQFL